VTIFTPPSGLKGKPEKKQEIDRRLQKSAVGLDMLLIYM
jgi:hypothetical protein